MKLLFAILCISTFLPYHSRTLPTPLDPRSVFESAYKKIWNAGFLISDTEAQKINAQRSLSTYGEIMWDSATKIFNDIAFTKKDVFYELGCGTGKVCSQLYLTTPCKKIVGIELSPTRLSHAYKAQKDILKQVKKSKRKKRKWEYRNENFLDSDLHDATVIYSLTIFENDVMKEITEKLATLKDGLRVITFKHLAPHPHFTLTKTYHLPMSWSPERGSPIYLYTLHKN